MFWRQLRIGTLETWLAHVLAFYLGLSIVWRNFASRFGSESCRASFKWYSLSESSAIRFTTRENRIVSVSHSTEFLVFIDEFLPCRHQILRLLRLLKPLEDM